MDETAYVALPGSDRTLVPGSKAVGPVNPAEVIEVTIRLRPRASAGDLDAALTSLGSTPPAERTYLTPEQFAAQYGADPAAIDKIAQFARDHQLTVVRSNVGQRTIVLSGTAQALSEAFKVQLVQYSSPQGQYRGRVGPLQIPADLQPFIEGIFGLDNRQQARPHIILPASGLRGASGGANVLTATLAQEARSFLPPQIGQYYNFPTNLDGTGQCIGIIEFGGGFSQSDLNAYFQQMGMRAPQVEAVSVDGVSNKPGADPESDGEVMLDIEVAASLAPGAKIVVYFAPFTEQGWVDVITTAVHDTQHRPSVLSISWGYTEGQDIWTSQAIQAVNQAFQAAGVLGVTICCASGDDGSEDQLEDGDVHVDFPAASPYVLGCGGTSLRFAGTNITGETVWNNGKRAQAGGATGGGISDMNALPAWQQGVVPPSVNPARNVGRGVPDVAGNADEQSGYTILVDGQTLNGVGGTSAVSPLWAALIARINQQLGKPVGFINPILYSQLGPAGVLRDITTGNNDPTGGSLGGYSAKAGWDACTGWGSPDGVKLFTALTGSTASSTGNANDPAPVSTTPGGNVLIGTLVVLIILVLLAAAMLTLSNLGVHIAGF
ncbi:MAG TPA: S53 family peptidase [Ktedonobacterales bacterium]|nr:S53 family peptidase [Ktedonobacterales bacterium]